MDESVDVGRSKAHTELSGIFQAAAQARQGPKLPKGFLHTTDQRTGYKFRQRGS